MYYKIAKENLNKLFNIDEINLDVNKLIIKKYVESGDVFKNDNDSEKTVLEKRIAYLIINYEDIFISLNEKEKDSENFLQKDKENLMAALLSDSRQVVLKISSSTLHSELSDLYQLEETKFVEPINMKFNKNFLMDLTQDGWDNEDFVLKKFNDFSVFNSGNYESQLVEKSAIDILSYTPSEKWNDEKFLEKIFKIKDMTTIFSIGIRKEKARTYNILYNQLVISKSVEFNNQFLVENYFNIYDELLKDNIYVSTAFSLKKTLKSNQQFSQLEKDILQKEKDCMEIFKLILEDINISTKLLDFIGVGYFCMFSEKIKKDEQFKDIYIEKAINKLLERLKEGNIYSFTEIFGLDYFSDSRVQLFTLKNAESIKDESYKPLLANQLVKKDDTTLIELLQNYKKTDYLWDFLSKEQKNNKNIALEMVKKNPKIYNKLSEILKIDKSMFKLYYEGLKKEDLLEDFKIGKLPTSFFESFSEEEMVDLVKFIPSFLLEEKFPLKFFNNINVLSLINLNHDVYSKLIKNEKYKDILFKAYNDKQVALKMLDNNMYTVYENFSNELKSDMEVLAKYTTRVNNIDRLPNKVFLNKNSLINMLKRGNKVVEKIPKIYLEDQDFLLKVFREIDSCKLEQSILSYLPTIVNEVIDSNELKIGTYYDFFSKAFSTMNLDGKLSSNSKIKQAKI